MIPGEDGPAVAEEPAVAWARRLEAAWRERDPDAVAALFTPDAAYHRGPFERPRRGTAAIAAHWVDTLARQAGAQIWFGAVQCCGRSGVVEFWCILKDPTTRMPRTAAGCVRFRLTADGRCAELREYWQALWDTARRPPRGWLP
jgi:SnoaL-like protein